MKTVYIVAKEKYKWKSSHKASKCYHTIVFSNLKSAKEYVLKEIGDNKNYKIDDNEYTFSAVNKKNGKQWTVIGWVVHK